MAFLIAWTEQEDRILTNAIAGIEQLTSAEINRAMPSLRRLLPRRTSGGIATRAFMLRRNALYGQVTATIHHGVSEDVPPLPRPLMRDWPKPGTILFRDEPRAIAAKPHIVRGIG